jgi:hypothetical protein
MTYARPASAQTSLVYRSPARRFSKQQSRSDKQYREDRVKSEHRRHAVGKSGRPDEQRDRGASAIANAVANNARDIPCGSRRAITEPVNPTNGAPKYIMLAGSSPRIPPTAAFIQTRSDTAATASPTRRALYCKVVYVKRARKRKPARPPERRRVGGRAFRRALSPGESAGTVESRPSKNGVSSASTPVWRRITRETRVRRKRAFPVFTRL